MATAVVIRPGQTDFDAQSRIQGSLDLPLNDAGSRQVVEMIDQLRSAPPEVIYTSPTEPALSTARRIAEQLDVHVRELDGLENLDHGLWQGMRLEDVRRKHPRVFKQWRESPQAVCPPEGETCEEAHERVKRALRKPMKKQKPFAVVAPEPLATLISSVLRGDTPCLPGPVCGCGDQQRIEWIPDVRNQNGRGKRAVPVDHVPVHADAG